MIHRSSTFCVNGRMSFDVNMTTRSAGFVKLPRTLATLRTATNRAADYHPWNRRLDGTRGGDGGRFNPADLSALGASLQRRGTGGTRRSSRSRTSTPSHAGRTRASLPTSRRRADGPGRSLFAPRQGRAAELLTGVQAGSIPEHHRVFVGRNGLAKLCEEPIDDLRVELRAEQPLSVGRLRTDGVGLVSLYHRAGLGTLIGTVEYEDGVITFSSIPGDYDKNGIV